MGGVVCATELFARFKHEPPAFSEVAVAVKKRAHQDGIVIIDEDGQDWFARIFGRGGFSLLANPARLTRALPDIYRTLTQET